MTHLQFLGSKVTALRPSKNRCRPTGPTFPSCPWSVSKAQKKTDLCSLPPLSWDVWYSSLTEQWVNPPSLSPSQQANIPVTTPTAEPINCLVYERNQWSPTTYTVSRWFHVVIILLTAISVQERTMSKTLGTYWIWSFGGPCVLFLGDGIALNGSLVNLMSGLSRSTQSPRLIGPVGPVGPLIIYCNNFLWKPWPS